MPVFNEERYLYDQNSNSELFHLYAFGKLLPDAGYIIARKNNPDTIIEFVVDGKGYIEADGFQTTVKKGDCYVLQSGCAHSYYSDEETPYTKLWITVSGSVVDAWLQLYQITANPFVCSLDITSYYNQIRQLALGKPSLDREKRLMLLVHGILFEMGLAAPASGNTQKSEKHYIKTSENIILDVKKYIEKQCNERLKMKELSQKFGISPDVLGKLFRAAYGQSPSRYHMQCKLESSIYFLESTDMSIDTISEMTGFCDRSHFRKVFAAHYGITPTRYRRAYLAQLQA